RRQLTPEACEFRFALDRFDAALLDDVQEVLLSPGLAPGDPAVAGLVQAARERGIPIIGEIELFARALVRLGDERAYAPKVLAITGTNGKTTVTSLTTW